MFTTIAWATDGSAEASETLPFMEGLAPATGAMLMINGVQEVTISRPAVSTPLADAHVAAVSTRSGAE